MTHLSDDQIISMYYDGVAPEARNHLDGCSQCRLAFERTRTLLDEARDYPVPDRPASYGGEVWTRLLPRLPAPAPRRAWMRWWTVAPALAAMLAIAFFAGVLTQSRTNIAGTSAKARERVLLIAMGDHLDRSQIVLAEIVNNAPGSIDLTDERTRARDLVDQNRLLRQTALHNGDNMQAALLDELERVLLDIANSPEKVTDADLESLRSRIEAENLLFKVRVFSTNVRNKGQQL
jgi:hypothetical protein